MTDGRAVDVQIRHICHLRNRNVLHRRRYLPAYIDGMFKYIVHSKVHDMVTASLAIRLCHAKLHTHTQILVHNPAINYGSTRISFT